MKEKVFVWSLMFWNVCGREVEKMGLGWDVYKMVRMGGERKIYEIGDEVVGKYGYFVENDEEGVSGGGVGLKKGMKVGVVGGRMKGVEG